MRLIDADKLDFSFDRRIFGEADENYIRGADDAISVVDNAETVEDVAPVVHGKWLDKTSVERALVEQRVDCSVCGHIFFTTTALSFNYCPNCGAKMD